jgi:hypothetical protein
MAKNQKFTTPAGIARYPWLNKPDTKFQPEGEYKVGLVLKKAEAKPLIDACAKLQKEVAALNKTKKLAKLPFANEEDSDGNETGNVIVSCKVKCRDGWDRKPKFFDAAGNRIDVKLGGGSKIKLNVELYGWHAASLGAGVTLQPVAVQVLDLVEFESGGNAESYGFGKEEGFVGETFDKSDKEDEAVSEEGEDADLY